MKLEVEKFSDHELKITQGGIHVYVDRNQAQDISGYLLYFAINGKLPLAETGKIGPDEQPKNCGGE